MTRTIKASQYDLYSHTINDIRNHYTVNVKKKKQVWYSSEDTSERHIPNDDYENFVRAHLKTGTGYIPTKPRAKYRALWEAITVWENEITGKK